MGGVSVAGLRPGFGRGGTIHSLLVRDMGGEVAAGEETADGGGGFMHIDGGLGTFVLSTAGAGGEPASVDILRRIRGVRLESALVSVAEHCPSMLRAQEKSGQPALYNFESMVFK